MPIPALSKVDCKYGAPMGRVEKRASTDNQRFFLQKVKFVDGDYDQGGAYWGGGTSPLWRYVSEDLTGEGFCRAHNREGAKRHILELYPKARFFR